MEKDCPNCKFELYEADEIPCKDCGIDDREYWQPKPKTNADRIRAMSDEELMQLLFTKISCGHICSFCVPTMRTERKCDGHCRNGVLKWLQQPAEGE
jgi:hypothetical protein